MAAIAYDWLSDLKQFINENSDPRTKDWPFMESPLPLVLLSICYLYFVCKAGPQYMKDRKPYDLKNVITIYNSCQILACIYLIVGLTSSYSFTTFGCEFMDYSFNPIPYRTAKIIWWAMLLKISEYTETVFFVLRKKQNQVSGLHLYHHISTLSIAWITSKFAPGEYAIVPIVINSIIHVLMYSYYLVALHGGKEIQKKIIFWKRSLTILQMVQFTIMIFHLLSGLRTHCTAPKFLLYFVLLNIFINYFLFYKFYRKTYKKNKET